MFRAFSGLMFWLLGWRIEDHRPPGLRQYIVVVAPHTSNMDFFIGLFTRSLARMGDVKYLAKKELFRPPLGWFFRAAGGFPVDRSKSTDLVEQVAGFFRADPDFKIAITPEGTRKHEGLVGPFKKGAFRIALDMQYPIVPLHIKGARQLCPGGSLSVTPGTVTVTYKPMIDTSDWKLETLDQHIQSVREQYLAWETEDIEQ